MYIVVYRPFCHFYVQVATTWEEVVLLLADGRAVGRSAFLDLLDDVPPFIFLLLALALTRNDYITTRTCTYRLFLSLLFSFVSSVSLSVCPCVSVLMSGYIYGEWSGEESAVTPSARRRRIGIHSYNSSGTKTTKHKKLQTARGLYKATPSLATG